MSLVLERVASHRRRRAPRDTFDVRDYFDGPALLVALKALHLAAGIDGVAHFDVVTHFRDALAAGREAVRRDLNEEGDGLRCATHLSAIEDELIVTLFTYVATHVHPAEASVRDRLVVAAVGGYGRDTLAPGSDIDLLFLLPAEDDAWELKAS